MNKNYIILGFLLLMSIGFVSALEQVLGTSVGGTNMAVADYSYKFNFTASQTMNLTTMQIYVTELVDYADGVVGIYRDNGGVLELVGSEQVYNITSTGYVNISVDGVINSGSVYFIGFTSLDKTKYFRVGETIGSVQNWFECGSGTTVLDCSVWTPFWNGNIETLNIVLYGDAVVSPPVVVSPVIALNCNDNVFDVSGSGNIPIFYNPVYDVGRCKFSDVNNQYIDVENYSSSSLSVDYSISFKFNKPSGSMGSFGQIYYDGSNSLQFGWISDDLYFYINNGVNNCEVYNNGDNLPVNTDTFLTINKVSNVVEVWLNGVNLFNQTCVDSVPLTLNNANLQLGVPINAGAGFVEDIMIDDFFLTNYSLSSVIIEELYLNSTPVVPISCSVCNSSCSPCGGGCSATSLYRMFDGVTDFNASVGDISGWNTSCIVNMEGAFINSDFNQDISGWDTSSVTNMVSMFSDENDLGIVIFNQPLNSWNVSSVTTFNSMFWGNRYFNQPLNDWQTFSATDVNAMFGSSAFNQPLNNWVTSSFNVLDGMFANSPFNQDIGSWNTSSVTSFDGMFANSPFNQDISLWDVSSASVFTNMFSGASSFDRNLGSWNVANLQDASGMFSGVNLSTFNYDSLLIGWANLSFVNCLEVFDGGLSMYSSNGVVSRDVLTNGSTGGMGSCPALIIVDGGLVNVVPSCVESWHPIYGSCSNNQFLTTFVDSNNCNTTIHLPASNGSLTACVPTTGGRSAGGSVVVGGSKEIIVPQSVLPSTPAPTTIINQPNVLVRLWNNLLAWFNSLVRG